MHGEAALLEVEEAARATEIVQQVPVDVQEHGTVAEVADDVLVPDLREQRSGRHNVSSPARLFSPHRMRAFSVGGLLRGGA